MQHAVREGAIERGRPENDEHERQEQQAAHRAPAAADRQLSPHHQQGRQGQRQRGQQRQPARAGPFDGIAGDSTNKAILVRRGAGDQGHQDLRNNTREGQRSEGQAEAEAARHRRLAPRHQCAGPQHRVREQWPDQIYDGQAGGAAPAVGQHVVEDAVCPATAQQARGDGVALLVISTRSKVDAAKNSR